MNEIITAGPLKFSEPNCPTRVGEIVENIEDIYSIPTPRLGMQVFVKSEKKSFVITSLKSKVIGGVNVPEAAVEAFEPVGARAVEADGLNFQTRANEVALDYKTIEGVDDEIIIPAATTTSAGVMSAADKVNLDDYGDAIQLNYEDIKRLDTNKAERSDAMQYDTLGVNLHADKAEIYGRSISGTPRTFDFPAATTEKAGVMTAEDKKEQVKKTPLVNGDVIVGQAREIHSRNGKTVTDSFLARTTAGSGTIGDGVASLKSVGGNVVKNLVDGTFESGWRGRYTVANGVSYIKPYSAFDGSGFPVAPISSHKYYISAYVNTPKTIIMRYGVDRYARTFDKWHILSNIVTNVSHNRIAFISSSTLVNFFVRNPLLIDLTEMYGAGNEPTLEECDKMFGTMDALPQGLSIAKPTEFKSTGFNQFNPENVLEGKAIVDNAIVNGDKKIAVIPCLPCKVGTGENNGYCIHGEFGDDIKVYLTPLNPMEVEGELYMHELTKDATTDTYVPQIKGYMLVEVPTTANLCAHFLWSEDKCERDTYEPYYESKVELPTIPEMPEYGLAGIQSSGTIVCDEIDFVKGVYRKKIGSVDMGSLTWRVNNLGDRFVSSVISGLKDKGYGKINNIISELYIPIKSTDTSSVFQKNADKAMFVEAYSGNSIVVVDSAYTDAVALKVSLQGVMLYYELAEPEEYPLPKVDNNYISSDYGVELFDGVVPCNANNLYYMRSLAGETRNFLDRMYDNTDKTDAKEVADYITNGIEGNKELATNAPNLALRALFVAAGAEYNDTDVNKAKTAPWGETVQHLPKHYYLNGLGDITEEQMTEIYNAGRVMQGVAGIYNSNKKIRTNLPSLHSTDSGYSRNIDGRGMFCICEMLEVAIISKNNSFADRITVDGNSPQYMFLNCPKVRYISKLDLQGGTSTSNMFKNCSSLSHVEIRKLSTNLSFSDSPLIDKESILYLIQKNTAKSAITITLHPDAYARLNPDLAENADIKSALEAQPLITLASA